MSFRVREATPGDIADIVPWTQDTFEWGDYVPERLPGWLDSPESHVVVCVDDNDRPVAVSHTVMLSATEAWLEAARVHPDHRRSGMGSAMNHAGTTWATQRGAVVARLATEASNEAAQRQVEAIGYRKTSTWVYGKMTPTERRLLDPKLGLAPAPVADVGPAWMTWSTGELARAGQDLIATGWRWRRAVPEDLAGAASRGEFLQSATGWIVVAQPEADWMRSGWLTTTPEDAPMLIDAVNDLALERGVAEVSLMVPAVPWLAETLARAAASPKEVFVYTLAL